MHSKYIWASMEVPEPYKPIGVEYFLVRKSLCVCLLEVSLTQCMNQTFFPPF